MLPQIAPKWGATQKGNHNEPKKQTQIKIQKPQIEREPSIIDYKLSVAVCVLDCTLQRRTFKHMAQPRKNSTNRPVIYGSSSSLLIQEALGRSFSVPRLP